ncbi:U6 snRNA-associated Sm-like protein LSm8 [Fistulifera solaris]|uniref:U6 snRNA-associated Sm-like protein LSm8 n=1 Tax=Fistulifera solaris TaxID=1519565 RepID=A0A1Z5JN52_FISSO|nr:U6 snRNA-associated Sm-like protein LSm8 [Fistulifera solaris]|eukprot:GAX15440.1 U6 snRNA-associated Sm-like protein LSm8 [Fistulifera solaris]
MASTLKEWKDKTICVVTCDGRIIIGKLIGHDQVQNLILNEAHERIYSEDTDVEEMPLGLYLVRGDNLCVVGEFDAAKMDDTIRVPEPLPHIYQQQM